MTRGEAAAMVQGLFRSFGENSAAGLNEAGLAGAAVAGARIALQYDRARGTLTSAALLYRMPSPLAEDRWKRMQAEARLRLPPGIQLGYNPDSRFLSLERVDSTPVPDTEFAEAILKLSARALEWDLNVLDQVLAATKA